MSTTLTALENIPPSVIGLPMEAPHQALSHEAATVEKEYRRVLDIFLVPVWTSEASVEQQFRRLVNDWEYNTGTSSSVDAIISDEGFLRIVRLGPKVVPMILAELRDKPSLLFVALHEITDEDPVLDEHCGDIIAMTNDWLDWGKQKGIS